MILLLNWVPDDVPLVAHPRDEAVVLDDVDRRPGLDAGLLHQDAEVEAQSQHEAGGKFNMINL